MPTPAEVRTGNLEGALIQAFVDLLLQNDAGFPTTPQDMLDAGANEFVSVSERDFKYAMAGYLILGFLELDAGYSCTDALGGPFTGENRSLARCIDQVVAAIQVGDPGYDGTWQTLAPKANEFASVTHRVRRGCLLYCAWAYLDQTGGAATLTEALQAGCCCGSRGLYQAIDILMAAASASGFPPPVTGVQWPSALDTCLLCRLESDDFDALANLTALTAWNDKGPGVNNFGIFAAGYEPWVDQVTTLNGHATVRHTRSTNDRHFVRLANWSNAPGVWSAAEVLAIMKVDNDPATGDLGSPFKFGNSSGADSHVPLNDGSVYENFGDALRPNSGNPATSFASAFVGYNVRATTGGNRIIKVGSETLENSAGHIWTAPATGSALTVGCSWVGNYTPPTYAHRAMDGNLAAVYCWCQILAGADRQSIADYILAKWGLTIPNT